MAECLVNFYSLFALFLGSIAKKKDAHLRFYVDVLVLFQIFLNHNIKQLLVKKKLKNHFHAKLGIITVFNPNFAHAIIIFQITVKHPSC